MKKSKIIALSLFLGTFYCSNSQAMDTKKEKFNYKNVTRVINECEIYIKNLNEFKKIKNNNKEINIKEKENSFKTNIFMNFIPCYNKLSPEQKQELIQIQKKIIKKEKKIFGESIFFKIFEDDYEDGKHEFIPKENWNNFKKIVNSSDKELNFLSNNKEFSDDELKKLDIQHINSIIEIKKDEIITNNEEKINIEEIDVKSENTKNNNDLNKEEIKKEENIESKKKKRVSVSKKIKNKVENFVNNMRGNLKQKKN